MCHGSVISIQDSDILKLSAVIFYMQLTYFILYQKEFMEILGSAMDNHLENSVLNRLPSGTLSYTFSAPLCRMQLLFKDPYQYFK